MGSNLGNKRAGVLGRGGAGDRGEEEKSLFIRRRAPRSPPASRRGGCRLPGPKPEPGPARGARGAGRGERAAGPGRAGPADGGSRGYRAPALQAAGASSSREPPRAPRQVPAGSPPPSSAFQGYPSSASSAPIITWSYSRRMPPAHTYTHTHTRRGRGAPLLSSQATPRLAEPAATLPPPPRPCPQRFPSPREPGWEKGTMKVAFREASSPSPFNRFGKHTRHE